MVLVPIPSLRVQTPRSEGAGVDVREHRPRDQRTGGCFGMSRIPPVSNQRSWPLDMTPITPSYDPVFDFRTRYPDWRLDVGETNGPVALVNFPERRAVFDFDQLDDSVFNLAYLVCLLDMHSSWPPSAQARREAGRMARVRLGL